MAEEIKGWVDARRRPLIRLAFGERHTQALAKIDTGFNGQLLFEGTDDSIQRLVRDLPHQYGKTDPVEVVGGSAQASLHIMPLKWFDQVIKCEVLVIQSNVRHGPDDPMFLVGTKLLSGCMLRIDFLDGTVVITRS